MTRGSIFVTKSKLPPLDEVIPHLQRTWDSKILSNGGPYHQQLEAALSRYLGVDHICLFANGTMALLVALKSLGVTGEVINAALGLVQLEHIDNALAGRKIIDGAYRERLRDIKGIRCLGRSSETISNYAYFPILLDSDYPVSRDELNNKLKDRDIHPRRYFYPLISEFPMYRHLSSAHRENLPIAYSASLQILCLPIYPDLDISVVDEICHVIRIAMNPIDMGEQFGAAE